MAGSTQRSGAPKPGFTAGYSVGEAARLLGCSTAQIHAWVRAGFLEPRRDAKGVVWLGFQDLVVLRTAKELAERIPARRVKRALLRLREQLPTGRGLAGLRITANGDDIVVRDGRSVWEPATGQSCLDFEIATLAEEVAPLARRNATAARNVENELTAEDWYDLACEMEAVDAGSARDAYRRALELDPEHFDARVNLGRLLHEAGEVTAAEANYRLALRLRPDDATASFNLGVALEDQRRPVEALRAYERALTADPEYADAHYNLAHLYEALGKPRSALRHLQTYRALVQEG